MKLTVDPTKADRRFVYYCLKAPTTTQRLIARASSSGVPHINLEIFRNFDICLPDLSIQRSVADALTLLDDLIAINRRRMENLLDAARLLYRKWFVHLRFPGYEHVELVDSDLGAMPAGWQVVRLGDILELAYGKALKAADRLGGPVGVYGSGGLVGQHDRALVPGPGIVVGRKGNVGSVHWSDSDFFPIDTTYFVKSRLPLRFLDQLLRTLTFVDSHAAVPGLSRHQAYQLIVTEPTGDLLCRYETAVRPMYDLRRNLSSQTAVLREARDLLLPRLVSGELDVSELLSDLETVDL
jgi:type I restriction enzyme S subunit